MSFTAPPLFAFDDSYARDVPELVTAWESEPVPAPVVVALNDDLARELGADPDELRRPDGVGLLVGAITPEEVQPVAQVYAGHQFGRYSPRLGDGRALLLGEVIDVAGRRRDLHVKGAGRTPFARGGDGKAALGPMLREYLMGEAMHHLGIPTTRALAVVASGEQIRRDSLLPGALLVRVAASHLRVGTFQYASASGDRDVLERLTSHAIDRHHPAAADAPVPALALLEHVIAAQSELVARWMAVGFVHGVLNTDNVVVSGETIDYGPCAFMDAHDPATVFSSIDHAGRYAYGNQPSITAWNLARFAETLLPLIDDDLDRAVEVATDSLQRFSEVFGAAWRRTMAAKLGIGTLASSDDVLVSDLLALLESQRVDHTSLFRALARLRRGEPAPARDLFADPGPFDEWAERWAARLADDGRADGEIADAMDCVNPRYVPRNHLVEEALVAATTGDLAPFEDLTAVLARPFDDQVGRERFAEPAPAEFGPYRTFCGT